MVRTSVEDNAGSLPGASGAHDSSAKPWALNGHDAAQGSIAALSSGADQQQRADRDGPGLARAEDDTDHQRLEEVVADCTVAIRLNPDDSRLYLERTKARSALQLHEAAIDDYDRVVRLDADNPAAYLGRCTCEWPSKAV